MTLRYTLEKKIAQHFKQYICEVNCQLIINVQKPAAVIVGHWVAYRTLSKTVEGSHQRDLFIYFLNLLVQVCLKNTTEPKCQIYVLFSLIAKTSARATLQLSLTQETDTNSEEPLVMKNKQFLQTFN